jgi:uncharacterized membrane protein YcaP (DUF421 family)
MSNMWVTDVPWWQLVIRASVVFVAVLLLLRVSGKRQVGQMGMAQFVVLILISNAVQNAMNGGDNSLLAGVILAAVLIGWSVLFEVATYRSKRLENLIQGRPVLLIHNGQVLSDHLQHERLSVRELRVMLRRQGVHSFAEVAEAVLESDGYVSIIHKSDVGATPGRPA